MDVNKFINTVLGDDGYYCLFAYNKDGKRTQKFFTDKQELLEESKVLDANGYNTFFGLATYKVEGSRKANNTVSMKSLFIDIDCGAGKDYATKREAFDALKEFCIKLKLPAPLVVDSGGGLHCYWVLTESVGIADWVTVAERLKRVCAEEGLYADPAVTSDAARVLRVPDTHNYKKDTPRPVKILGHGAKQVNFDYFASLLGEDMIPVPVKIEGTNAVWDALAGNVQSNFKKILDKTAKGKGCAQIAYIVKNQATLDEPMWRAGLSIVKFCTDATKAAKFISHKHPEYTEEATQDKMDKIKGPYLCTTFEEFNPDGCKDCPHRNKIKSPINLGREIQEATEEDNVVVVEPPKKAEKPEEVNSDLNSATIALNIVRDLSAPITYNIPTYPKPYFRGKTGGIYYRQTSADGEVEEKLVYHNDFYAIRRVKDPELGEAVILRLHLPIDGVIEFSMPLTAVTSRDEFRKHMAMKGVAVPKIEELMIYMIKWINELQATTIAEDARRQFGWIDDCKGFVLGNKEYRTGSIIDNHPSAATSQYFKAFEPKGSLEDWKQIPEFFNRDGMELHQIVMLLSFASPLVEFVDKVNGVSLHIHSKDGGFGKTTALWAGASVWGDPEALTIRNSDTANFLWNRAEIYKNILLPVDEITNADPKVLGDNAYVTTGGQQRGRMTGGSNVERVRGEPWALATVMTGNKSIIEAIATTKAAPLAEARRILEVKAKKFEGLDKRETDRFNGILSRNYGWAGAVYVNYLIRHIDEVRELLQDVTERVDEHCALDQQDRFWSALSATVLTACVITNKLGLVNYDMDKILATLKAIINENRKAVLSMNIGVQQLLSEYLSENINNILQIKSTDDLRKQGNNNGLDTLVIPDATPKARLVGRYETDINRAYLIPKYLKSWCARQQLSYGSFLEDLIKDLGAKRGKIRLTKGTHLNMPPSDVLIVDCHWRDSEDANTED
jgi:hypothetical protein